MPSAAKFWPPRLFGWKAKSEAEQAFEPTTEIAARIIGKGSPGANGNLQAFEPPVSLPDFADLEMDYTADREPGSPANDTAAARQAQRFVPQRAQTFLTDKRNKQLRARIINLSATGVAIEADFRVMPPDSVAMVGSKSVTPGRPIRGGHVFIFDKVLDPARCNPQIVL